MQLIHFVCFVCRIQPQVRPSGLGLLLFQLLESVCPRHLALRSSRANSTRPSPRLGANVVLPLRVSSASGVGDFAYQEHKSFTARWSQGNQFILVCCLPHSGCCTITFLCVRFCVFNCTCSCALGFWRWGFLNVAPRQSTHVVCFVCRMQPQVRPFGCLVFSIVSVRAPPASGVGDFSPRSGAKAINPFCVFCLPHSATGTSFCVRSCVFNCICACPPASAVPSRFLTALARDLRSLFSAGAFCQLVF